MSLAAERAVADHVFDFLQRRRVELACKPMTRQNGRRN